jgi:hypothetical protein
VSKKESRKGPVVVNWADVFLQTWIANPFVIKFKGLCGVQTVVNLEDRYDLGKKAGHAQRFNDIR